MAETKSYSTSYTISSINGTDFMSFTDGSGVVINADLDVIGTITKITSTDTEIADNTILLNSGESGAGVTLTTSGVIIDRGSSTDVSLRWDDSIDDWQLTRDGSTYEYILTSATSSAGMTELLDDLTPTLGGELKLNAKTVSNKNDAGTYLTSDLVIDTGTVGELRIENGVLKIDEVSDPSSEVGYSKLYAKAAGAGESGLYFSNNSHADELISRSKAIVLGMIL
jgi:hypothetical protein